MADWDNEVWAESFLKAFGEAQGWSSGGVSDVTRVIHGANAATARPDVTYVEWVGSVEPENGAIVDTWINTA